MKKETEQLEQFSPTFLADVKYMLDDFFEKGTTEVSTTELYAFYKELYEELPFTKTQLNNALCELCIRGVICQVNEEDDYEYKWSLKAQEKEEEAPKKKNKKKEKAEAAPKTGMKFATKMRVDTDQGPIEYYTIMPDKYVAEECKGFWVCESDEAIELYLFDKSMKQNIVKELVMQLINCDKKSVKVMKNF